MIDMEEMATPKQISFIKEMRDFTYDWCEPEKMTKREASKWISEHIDEYDLATTNWDLVDNWGYR